VYYTTKNTHCQHKKKPTTAGKKKSAIRGIEQR
jgi:hypothetical protein